MQRAEQNSAWDKEPQILASGLDEACEIGHFDTLSQGFIPDNRHWQKKRPFGGRFQIQFHGEPIMAAAMGFPTVSEDRR